MFYEPGKTSHGLPHDPFKACVVPRPIGWISTVSPTSSRHQKPVYNLAPYSQFTNVTYDPPYVMFSSNQTPTPRAANEAPLSEHEQHSPGFNRKDTVHNAESTGYFCWQLATYPLRDLVNKSAEPVPYGVSEFEKHGIRTEVSRTLPIQVPMVADSPVKFECKYHSTLRLPANPPMGTVDIVIGLVVAVHIDDAVLKDGRLDPHLTQPIARLGYYDYTVVRETFQMVIPTTADTATVLAGLEGSPEKSRGEPENPVPAEKKEEEVKQ